MLKGVLSLTAESDDSLLSMSSLPFSPTAARNGTAAHSSHSHWGSSVSSVQSPAGSSRMSRLSVHTSLAAGARASVTASSGLGAGIGIRLPPRRISSSKSKTDLPLPFIGCGERHAADSRSVSRSFEAMATPTPPDSDDSGQRTTHVLDFDGSDDGLFGRAYVSKPKKGSRLFPKKPLPPPIAQHSSDSDSLDSSSDSMRDDVSAMRAQKRADTGPKKHRTRVKLAAKKKKKKRLSSAIKKAQKSAQTVEVLLYDFFDADGGGDEDVFADGRHDVVSWHSPRKMQSLKAAKQRDALLRSAKRKKDNTLVLRLKLNSFRLKMASVQTVEQFVAYVLNNEWCVKQRRKQMARWLPKTPKATASRSVRDFGKTASEWPEDYELHYVDAEEYGDALEKHCKVPWLKPASGSRREAAEESSDADSDSEYDFDYPQMDFSVKLDVKQFFRLAVIYNGKRTIAEEMVKLADARSAIVPQSELQRLQQFLGECKPTPFVVTDLLSASQLKCTLEISSDRVILFSTTLPSTAASETTEELREDDDSCAMRGSVKPHMCYVFQVGLRKSKKVSSALLSSTKAPKSKACDCWMDGKLVLSHRMFLMNEQFNDVDDADAVEEDYYLKKVSEMMEEKCGEPTDAFEELQPPMLSMSSTFQSRSATDSRPVMAATRRKPESMFSFLFPWKKTSDERCAAKKEDSVEAMMSYTKSGTVTASHSRSAFGRRKKRKSRTRLSLSTSQKRELRTFVRMATWRTPLDSEFVPVTIDECQTIAICKKDPRIFELSVTLTREHSSAGAFSGIGALDMHRMALMKFCVDGGSLSGAEMMSPYYVASDEYSSTYRSSFSQSDMSRTASPHFPVSAVPRTSLSEEFVYDRVADFRKKQAIEVTVRRDSQESSSGDFIQTADYKPTIKSIFGFGGGVPVGDKLEERTRRIEEKQLECLGLQDSFKRKFTTATEARIQTQMLAMRVVEGSHETHTVRLMAQTVEDCANIVRTVKALIATENLIVQSTSVSI